MWVVFGLTLNTLYCEWPVVWILTPPTCEWSVVWILTPPIVWVACGLNLDTPCHVSGLWFESLRMWVMRQKGAGYRQLCSLEIRMVMAGCRQWQRCVCDHFHFICVWRVVSLMVCPASHSYCFTCPRAYYWRSSTVLDGGMDDLSLALAIQMKVVCLV